MIKKESIMTATKLQPIHPGEILREEFLVPLGISRRQFAKQLGVPATRLNDIVLERRGITADTALRLAKALGTTPEFWMNLQQKYDLDMAKAQSWEQIDNEVKPVSV